MSFIVAPIAERLQKVINYEEQWLREAEYEK